MRKLLAPFLILVLFLTGCMPSRIKITEDNTVDVKLEQVMDVLKTRDRNAAKNLFSKQALADTDDIENGIDYLFSLVKGDVTTVGDITWGSDEHRQNGENVRKIFSWCDFSTAEQDYHLFMLIYDRDDTNRDNIGLYSLRVVAYDKNYAKHIDAWQYMQQPGIYAPSEQQVLRAAVIATEQYSRQFAKDSTDPLTLLPPQSNYVGIHAPVWAALPQAFVLNSKGTFFAIVDVGIYPEYTQPGPAMVGDVPVEVVPNSDESYSLLYEQTAKPPDTVIEAFAKRERFDSDDSAANTDNLSSFYYRFGGDVQTEYELLSLSLINDNSNYQALLYVRENGNLLDGYPIEVTDSKLSVLNSLLQENEITAWNGDFTSEEKVADGENYFLSLQYQRGYLFSTGTNAFPEGYKKGHDALITFFQKIIDQHKEAVANSQLAKQAGRPGEIAQIETLDIWFNETLSNEITKYKMESTGTGLSLSYGTVNGWIINDFAMPADAEQRILEICKNHNVFSWNGYNLVDSSKTDSIMLGGLFLDPNGEYVVFNVYGVGNKPDGWDEFIKDITSYLNGVLGL